MFYTVHYKIIRDNKDVQLDVGKNRDSVLKLLEFCLETRFLILAPNCRFKNFQQQNYFFSINLSGRPSARSV